jgi:transposase
MGQLQRFISQVLGVQRFKCAGWVWRRVDGVTLLMRSDLFVPPDAALVLRLERVGPGYCPECGLACRKTHETLDARQWRDLSWGTHPVFLQYAPRRVKCPRCRSTPVEWLPWADPHRRETVRFQQMVALEAASMPVSHVAAKHSLSWDAIKGIEMQALARWERSRTEIPLRMVGIDEKYLGRRGAWPERYITIISNLETGEPIWTSPGRGEASVKQWLDTLSPEQKAGIKLFASDMHAPFQAAVKADPELAHTVWVHDPFHVIKRANQAVDELRRETFFRASPELRAVGRGKRWLVLRAWEKTTPEQRAELRKLFSLNPRLANAYQILEELRQVLHAPDRASMSAGLMHVLRRTERRANKPMRKLHDSLEAHWNAIVALGEHHPPTGRIEALNTNWEALVRRGRGYRDLDYLLLKLRFMTANPIRDEDGTRRFLALGMTPPARIAA